MRQHFQVIWLKRKGKRTKAGGYCETRKGNISFRTRLFPVKFAKGLHFKDTTRRALVSESTRLKTVCGWWCFNRWWWTAAHGWVADALRALWIDLNLLLSAAAVLRTARWSASRQIRCSLSDKTGWRDFSPFKSMLIILKGSRKNAS